jgi:hypothetical protein
MRMKDMILLLLFGEHHSLDDALEQRKKKVVEMSIFHGVTSRDGAELAVTIPSSSCRNLKVRNNYSQEVTLLSSLAPAKPQVGFWELIN